MATALKAPTFVPRVALPNPHIRQPSLHTVKTLRLEGEDEHEPLPSGVSLKKTDEQFPRIKPRTATPDFYRGSARSPSPEITIGMAVSSYSPMNGTTPSPSIAKAPKLPKTIPPPPRGPPPSSPELSSSRSGSATLVQTTSTAAAVPSPVVPIRSMFPTYNPTVPLTQQSYYPQRPIAARQSHNVSREDYRYSQLTPIDRGLGSRTAPPSIVNFPSDVMSITEPQFSSHRELEKLWDATHGTEPTSLIKKFDLEMSRTSEATFVFGADPQFPFYTLKTFDTNEIQISKTSPQKRTELQDIFLSALEPPERRDLPNDGLVAFLFPKMAAIMAINQSENLAKQHQLASTDRDDVEAAAIRRAAQQEACNLRWDAKTQRYELDHPAIARRAKDPNFLKSPTSPQLNNEGKQVLHITVSSSSYGSPITSTSAPPVIIVTNPNATPTTRENSPAAGIRLSTLPQSDTDFPLASLDLGTMTLNIDAHQILDLMPSLFAIDCVVSAMFAIAIADESTNPVMGSMDIWRPRPKAPRSQYGGSVKSYAGSTFYATIAEREEAEEEARQAKEEHEQDVKLAKKGGAYTGKRSWYGKKERVKDRRKRVMMAEFDLEKLGTYQAGERKGQELPAVTRGVVGGLVGALRFVVWLLTMVVQCVCWALVNSTRCLTSEKF